MLPVESGGIHGGCVLYVNRPHFVCDCMYKIKECEVKMAVLEKALWHFKKKELLAVSMFFHKLEEVVHEKWGLEKDADFWEEITTVNQLWECITAEIESRKKKNV